MTGGPARGRATQGPRVRPDLPRGAVTARDGLVLLDKPQGLTSHDVVARVRRLAATKKVGHAGTLDPMATGVLVLGVGRATRLLTYLVGADKVYTGTIRLGQTTVTDDAEGDVTAAAGAAELLGPDGNVQRERVDAAMAALTGEVEQVPSAVSAIKVGGQRSYARVRAGEDVQLPARPVRVDRFDVVGEPRVVAGPAGSTLVDVDVEVTCSSGTYVRALARDVGAALGTGGHLTALRRTRVGPFAVDAAWTLEDLATQVARDAESYAPQGLAVVGITDAVRATFPVRDLSPEETIEVRFGKFLTPTGAGTVTAALAPDGHAVALLADRDGRARPVLVLDPA